MTAITEGLLCTHSATAPSIDFVVDFRVLYGDRPHDWTDWPWGLLLGQGVRFP